MLTVTKGWQDKCDKIFLFGLGVQHDPYDISKITEIVAFLCARYHVARQSHDNDVTLTRASGTQIGQVSNQDHMSTPNPHGHICPALNGQALSWFLVDHQISLPIASSFLAAWARQGAWCKWRALRYKAAPHVQTNRRIASIARINRACCGLKTMRGFQGTVKSQPSPLRIVRLWWHSSVSYATGLVTWKSSIQHWKGHLPCKVKQFCGKVLCCVHSHHPSSDF